MKLMDQSGASWRPSVEIGDQRPLITITIPVYNEEEALPGLLRRLDAVTTELARYRFEYLFTDNASTDLTFELLAEAAITNPRIRVIRFTRNVGFQASILVNYLEARGVAAIQIDADLQDPPELFATFLDRWEKGYKVVYGVRRSRPEGPLLRLGRQAFYRILHRLSTVDVPVDAGDFRLIDRVVIDRLREVHDNSPYIRGIIAEFGYAQIGVPYDRSARTAGKSKFRLFSLIRLAIDGIASQSTKPLEFITLFGTVLSVLSMMGAGAYLAWFAIVPGPKEPGFTTIVILLLLSTGINAAFVGLLGEYIGRIFKNTRQIPLPIVDRRIDPLPTPASSEAPTLVERANSSAGSGAHQV